MNENLNLVEILKDCPKGTKLYSPIFGDVELVEVRLNGYDGDYPIAIKLSNNSNGGFTKDGRVFVEFDGECIIFPSREQRDWSQFKVKKPKFDPKTLKPFDKILVRDTNEDRWKCALYSHTIENEQCIYKYVTLVECGVECGYKHCIPYNDDTEHLLNTTKEAPEYYRYWEE